MDTFYLTPDVLSILPATANGILTVSSGVQASFDAPGSDANAILFQSGAGRSVVIN